jgi:uncharacterized membrane protein
MNSKTFFLIGVIFLCVFLAGILVGATIAAKAQRDIDNRKIEAMTEQNERVLDRVENLNAVIANMLGLKRTKDMPIARPGTGD